MPEKHPHALPSGHRIEEYEIVRVLGAGGFGITYLATDTKLDGPVALKEYFPHEHAVREADQRVAALPAEESRALFTWGLDRFLDEARSIHRFRHPNVVRVHRYIEALGTACIVMEYVEGESLDAVLRTRAPLPAAEWRRWLGRLLDGLEHVHGHGYVHRDITPANIVHSRGERRAGVHRLRRRARSGARPGAHPGADAALCADRAARDRGRAGDSDRHLCAGGGLVPRADRRVRTGSARTGRGRPVRAASGTGRGGGSSVARGD